MTFTIFSEALLVGIKTMHDGLKCRATIITVISITLKMCVWNLFLWPFIKCDSFQREALQILYATLFFFLNFSLLLLAFVCILIQFIMWQACTLYRNCHAYTTECVARWLVSMCIYLQIGRRKYTFGIFISNIKVYYIETTTNWHQLSSKLGSCSHSPFGVIPKRTKHQNDSYDLAYRVSHVSFHDISNMFSAFISRKNLVIQWKINWTHDIFWHFNYLINKLRSSI